MDHRDSITVIVDGLSEQIPAGLTLAELLERRGEPVKVVMAEHNGDYVPQARLATVRLEDGDRIEIILPAFGG
jgi:sulfur carrier protein